MAFDRNRTEQQAIKYAGRGQHDRAIDCYIEILRHDQRDVRARQKIAELFLKTGRRQEAFRQLAEVAKLHEQGGNPRAAASVYSQLVRLKPSDPELRGSLADAYFAAGYNAEAAPHYEKAFEELSRVDPDKAVYYGRQLLSIRYDDLALRLKMARMLLSGGDENAAYALYKEAIDEYRRRGQMDEVARTARLALAAKPDDADLMVDAAEACLASDDTAQALEYLREAYTKDASNVRVLDMLAGILRDGEAPERARPVYLQLARLHEAEGNVAQEVEALEAAQAVGSPSMELTKALADARRRLERVQFRLSSLESAQPGTDDELRVCTRAEVFLRYGFPERAAPELQSALAAAPDSLALLAWMAELAIAQGDEAQGIAYAQTLSRMVPPGDRAKVHLRLEVLGVEAPPAEEAPSAEQGPTTELIDDEDELLDDEDELLDDELIDDELIDDPVTDTGESVADEPTAPPVREAPIAPPPPRREAPIAPPPPRREAPIAPPPPESVDPFADLGAAQEDSGGGLFADVFRGGGGFSEEPEAPTPAATPAPAPSANAVEEARGLLGLGMPQDALALLQGQTGLAAAVLRARCHREQGENAQALRELKGVLLDAPDDSPVLAGALFEFADLAAREGRRRAALRALVELAEFHPEHRAAEVSARVKALRRVLGR
ncbi:MAG: tetratricopeptide repeat protein [Alphaproteobacteria bacterium]|nr:tetratricopeptide repeat protein [Alphaproteobacteria bacterium]MCB9792609.1 tetratricopeptide repeat protein [Alphaproteobacteria bacterium]